MLLWANGLEHPYWRDLSMEGLAKDSAWLSAGGMGELQLHPA